MTKISTADLSKTGIGDRSRERPPVTGSGTAQEADLRRGTADRLRTQGAVFASAGGWCVFG